MKFGSLFSGIGGFDLGFERAGMECAWQIEIDKDCGRVLSKQWPDVERFEDVTKCGRLPDVDVCVGGFPCQDLSVAGQREGLAGERSGLWFEFLRIIELNRPRFIVIENVPGLLSSWSPVEPPPDAVEGCEWDVEENSDFETILIGLSELGYCLASRILDAQYDGVAQRRERVFIVGSLGDGSCAEILFESDSVSWNPPTRGEARERVAATVKASPPNRRNGGSDPIGDEFVIAATLKQRGRGACDEVMDNLQIAGSLASHAKKHGHAMTTQQAAESNHLVSIPLKAKANSSHDESHETYIVDVLEHHRFHCLACGHWFGVNDYEERIVTCPNCGETHIDKITDVLDVHLVTATAYRTSGNCGPFEQGDKTGALNTATDPSQNIICFSSKDHGADAGEISPTLCAQNSKDSRQSGGGQVAIAFDTTQITSKENRSNPQEGDPCYPLAAEAQPPVIAFRACGQDGFTPSEEVTPPIVATKGGGANAPTIAFDHCMQGSERTFIHRKNEKAQLQANRPDAIAGNFGVRRLTPRECERLQGFPDDWTLCDADGHIISDSARYRMLGNAVAVPVAEWIAKRILCSLSGPAG